jgi:cell division cycle 2-like protein
MLLEKPDYDALVDMGELITGRAPFQGQDSEDQLCAIVGFVNGALEGSYNISANC